MREAISRMDGRAQDGVVQLVAVAATLAEKRRTFEATDILSPGFTPYCKAWESTTPKSCEGGRTEWTSERCREMLNSNEHDPKEMDEARQRSFGEVLHKAIFAARADCKRQAHFFTACAGTLNARATSTPLPSWRTDYVIEPFHFQFCGLAVCDSIQVRASFLLDSTNSYLLCIPYIFTSSIACIPLDHVSLICSYQKLQIHTVPSQNTSQCGEVAEWIFDLICGPPARDRRQAPLQTLNRRHTSNGKVTRRSRLESLPQ